jgi:hypothetical protein
MENLESQQTFPLINSNHRFQYCSGTNPLSSSGVSAHAAAILNSAVQKFEMSNVDDPRRELVMTDSPFTFRKFLLRTRARLDRKSRPYRRLNREQSDFQGAKSDMNKRNFNEKMA